MWRLLRDFVKPNTASSLPQLAALSFVVKDIVLVVVVTENRTLNGEKAKKGSLAKIMFQSLVDTQTFSLTHKMSCENLFTKSQAKMENTAGNVTDNAADSDVKTGNAYTAVMDYYIR